MAETWICPECGSLSEDEASCVHEGVGVIERVTPVELAEASQRYAAELVACLRRERERVAALTMLRDGLAERGSTALTLDEVRHIVDDALAQKAVVRR